MVVYLIGEFNHDYHDIKYTCLSKETAEKRFNEIKAEILKAEKDNIRWLSEDIVDPPHGDLPEWVEYMKERIKSTELDIEYIEAHKFGENVPPGSRWCTTPSWDEKEAED